MLARQDVEPICPIGYRKGNTVSPVSAVELSDSGEIRQDGTTGAGRQGEHESKVEISHDLVYHNNASQDADAH